MSFNLCQYSNEWSKSLLNLNLFTDEKLKQGRSLAKLALPFIALYQPWQKPIFYGKNLLNISCRYKNLTTNSSPQDLMKVAQSVLEIGTLALGNLKLSLMVNTAAELMRSFPKLMDKNQRSPLLMAEAGSKALYLLSLVNKQSTPCQIASLVTEGCLSIYRAHLLTKDIQQLTVDANLHTIINNKKGLKGLTQAAMGVIRLYGAYQQKLAATTQTGHQELASFFHQNKQIVIIQNSQSNLQKYILYAGAAALAYRFWEPLAYCLSCLKDFVTGLNSPHLKQMDQNVEEEKEANQTYQEDLASRQDNTQKFGQIGERLKEKRAEENQAYEADLNNREENIQNFGQAVEELDNFQIEQNLKGRWLIIEQKIELMDPENSLITSEKEVEGFLEQTQDLIQDYQNSSITDKEIIIAALEKSCLLFEKILESCALEEESDSSDELEMSSDSDISSGADSPPSSPIASPILSRSSTFKQKIAQQLQTLTIKQTTSSFVNPVVIETNVDSTSTPKITPLEIHKPKATKTLTISLDQISNPSVVLDIPSPQVIEQIKNNLEDIIEYQASVSDTQTAIIEPEVAVVESSNSAKKNTTLSSVKKASLENSQEKTVQKTTQVFAKKANVQEEIDLNLEFLFPSIPSLTPLQTAEKETEQAEIELRKIEETKLKEQSTAKSLVQIAKDLLAETDWMTLVFDQELEDQLKFSIDQANLLLSSLELIPEEKEVKNLNNKIEELRGSISNLKEEIKKFSSEIAILEQAKVEKLTPEAKLSITVPGTEAKILAKSTKDSKAAVENLKSQIVDLTSKLNTDTTRLTANLNAKMQLLKNLNHNIEEKTTQLISEKERLQIVITKIEADHLESFKYLSKERIKKPVVALNALRQLATYDAKLAKNLVEAQNIKDRNAYLHFYTTEINKLEKTLVDPKIIQNLRTNFLPILDLYVIDHIRSYLPPVEQVRLTQVSKSWKEKGKSAEFKQCYLLIKEFRTLIPNLEVESHVKNQLRSQYYRLLAHLNLQKALKEANQIKTHFWSYDKHTKDPALFEIIKVATLSYLAVAKQIVSMIKDPYYKAQASVTIAKVDSLYDLTEAKEAAKKIEDPEKQAQTFIEIAKLDPLHDITETKKLFDEFLANYPKKDLAFISIIKIGILKNLDFAKEIINDIEDSFYKDKALIEITKAEALKDVDEAIETVKKITNTCYKDKALIEVVKIEAVKNLNAAIKIVEKINDLNNKFKAFIEIAKVDPFHNLTAAAEAVKQIGSDYEKAQALIEIAKVDPSHNLTAAIKAIEEMGPAYYYKAQAFIEIAKIDPSHNLTAAREAVKKMGPAYYHKTQVLIEIAKVDSLHDLTAAREAASEITDFVEKAKAFIEIAKVDLLHDLTEAKKAASEITEANDQALAFIEIAKVLF
jgi:hypothetical protein